MITTNLRLECNALKHGITSLILSTIVLAATATSFASDAETSAQAAANRRGPGTATATARYEGDVGFARTDTRTGRVNAARAVALGVDEDGLTLSVSTALAPNRGPALAVNFNMSIDTRGGVASSIGTSTINGGAGERRVAAGGSATARPGGSVASSVASGHTDFGGVVRVHTESHNQAPRQVVVRRIVRMP